MQDASPTISIIVAMASNRVIGIDNSLPWHLPADLKYFKSKTLNHPIIMGRKNYESIGRPLPQRENIVVSSNPDYKAPGCTVVNSLRAAIEHSSDQDEIFIIGGATIYQQTLPLCGRIYLTQIHRGFNGDTHFPDFDKTEWNEISKTQHKADANNPLAYDFTVLERKKQPERLL